MYKRDVGVVLVSCVAILVSLQHEGSFSFRKSWVHIMPGSPHSMHPAHDDLPAPVVADLNGDGSFEVLLATHDLKLRIIRPQHISRYGEAFASADVIKEVNLLGSKPNLAAGRRPVALAVGHIDPLPTERVRPPRKSVVVVVTNSLQIMVYDHLLNLLWTQSIAERFPDHARVKEVGVYISHHEVNKGDRGMVVVGASLEVGDLASGEGLELKKGFSDYDVLQKQMQELAEQQAHSRSSGESAELKDLDKDAAVKGVATSRHFSYVSFEGGKGDERWEHKSEDFHKNLDEVQDQTRPQMNYRLEAEALEGRHYGELSCRDYRDSILAALPHSWAALRDTSFEPAHFVKHKEGRGAQKHALGQKKRVGNPVTTKLLNPPLKSSMPPTHSLVQVGHSTHHNISVNALVAHLEEGLEVIHLFTGRTICKLHLPPGGLHQDINGDGVPDHVMVYSDTKPEIITAGHPAPGNCEAVVRSGIPPRTTQFSTTVCSSHRFMGNTRLSALSSDLSSTDVAIEFAHPVLLPLARASGSFSRQHHHGVLMFMTNRGEITAVSSKGSHLWQAFFPTAWAPRHGPGSLVPGAHEMAAVPTLKVMALRHHAWPTAVLAAGAHAFVAVSEHGNVMATGSLPAPPTQPLVIADFNGDGLNDLIVVTSGAVFGYIQVRHFGGHTLSAVMLTLIIAMGIVYYTQQYEGGLGLGGAKNKQKKLRSTDFAD